MKIWKHIAIGILLAAIFTACLKSEEFPPEPYLEYLSFTNDPENAVMRFNFTDGDGNVGLDNRDTMPPFHPTADPVNLYHWNFWLNYYERVNGEWVQYDLDPNAVYSRIPRLDPDGQNKALEGEVVVDMTGWFPLNPAADTVRYGAILVDRDLNKSNEAFSEMIIISN